MHFSRSMPPPIWWCGLKARARSCIFSVCLAASLFCPIMALVANTDFPLFTHRTSYNTFVQHSPWPYGLPTFIVHTEMHIVLTQPTAKLYIVRHDRFENGNTFSEKQNNIILRLPFLWLYPMLLFTLFYTLDRCTLCHIVYEYNVFRENVFILGTADLLRRGCSVWRQVHQLSEHKQKQNNRREQQMEWQRTMSQPFEKRLYLIYSIATKWLHVELFVL